MTLSRSMLHTLRDERAPRPAALVAGRRFNVSATMRRAIGIARTLRCLPTWRQRMQSGLLHAWKLARAEMAAAAPLLNSVQAPTPAPREAIRIVPVRRSAEAVRSWSRPVRVNVHGW